MSIWDKIEKSPLQYLSELFRKKETPRMVFPVGQNIPTTPQQTLQLGKGPISQEFTQKLRAEQAQALVRKKDMIQSSPNFLQSTLQVPLKAGLFAARTFQNPTKSRPIVYNPKGLLAESFFGTSPITDIGTDVSEAGTKTQKSIEKLSGTKQTAPMPYILGAVGVAGENILNAWFGKGSAAKSAAKNILKDVEKQVGKEVAEKVAQNVAKETSEVFTKKLAGEAKESALQAIRDKYIPSITKKVLEIKNPYPVSSLREVLFDAGKNGEKDLKSVAFNWRSQEGKPMMDKSLLKAVTEVEQKLGEVKTIGLLKPLEKQVQKVPTPALAKPLPTGLNQLPNQKDISFINKVNTNLNLEHINVSPESKNIIQQTVEEVKPLIEAKVGKKLSNQEAVKMANQSSKVLNRVVGREETLDWQASMLKARQALAHASENGVVDEAYIKNLLTIKTQGTDIARKLQSLSIGADPIEQTAKQAIMEAVMKTNASTDEILKAAKGVDFNDLNQATEFYRKFIKPTAQEWIDLLRYNSMLSSPKTHIVNIFSNLLNTAVVAPVEKTLTGGLDFLSSKITRNPRQYYAGEGIKHLTNYFKNIKDATQRFSDVMKGQRVFTNLDTRSIPVADKGVKGAIAKTLSVPTKLLEGMDQFFTALVEGASKGSLEYRASKGVKVSNIDALAQKEARYRLYRQKPLEGDEGHLLNAIDQFTKTIMGLRNNKNPIVSMVSKFTVPFIQTPMNIFKQGIEYSPMGFGTLSGAKNKTEQLSKAIIGSSIFAASATLLASDRLTFGEPIDETGRRNFRENKMQPYSVKIGNRWVSYQKLPPAIAFPLALVAGINDAVKNKKVDDGTVNLILSSVSKYGTFLSEQSYAKSIGDILSSVKGGEAGLENVISNYGQQFVPYRAFGGWLSKLIDQTQRKVDTKADFIDKQVQLLMMNIPGLSQKVPARLDSEGQPISISNPIFNAFSPVQTSEQTSEQSKEYENIQEIKRMSKEITALNAKEKERIQPIYNQAKALLNEGRDAEADALVADMSDEDYEIYKKIRTSERSKTSERLRDLLSIDPKAAVEFLRSQNKREQQRLLDNLTDEEYEIYKSGK
jgi:hypothetical protein